MESRQPPDRIEMKSVREEEEERPLDWLLKKDGSETSVPMDTNVPCGSSPPAHSNSFTRERVFIAASQGDTAQLHGLLDYLRVHDKRLTSPEFTDETNGKTALLKALLNLKQGKNDTIQVLLDVSEKTGDLEHLINASYTDPFYKGQTALHVAIERRSFDLVKLLVQKGADVQAKANGKFFQHSAGLGFYFGELPLSLAACTNQPDIVSFLMENPHRRADLTDKDSQGNTVLHILVIIADNTEDNTEMVAKMYDDILIQHNRLEAKRGVQLEAIENNEGLTPLKLAAKRGRIGLLRHMLQREFKDEEKRPLSRKLTEWVYGPVRSSLYDMTSIDTDEKNSVLEIIIFGSEIPNRPEMLQIEPLRSVLEDKWQRFASKLFLMNFVMYLTYLVIFTAVSVYRKEGQPPFPFENSPADFLRGVGELISVLGAVWFLCKAVIVFQRNPPNLKALFTDGFSDIMFFLQALLLLVCVVLYGSGRKEYVGLLVLSLALAWINVLFYSRGSKRMGIYHVMMQRVILGDLIRFLCVYSVLLFGFSAAVVTLMDDTPHDAEWSAYVQSLKCKKPSFNDISFTTLELFKFTIGMGDLEFTDLIQFKAVFYILLISYIVLTYILLFNMLIALMGNTVERISEQSENIWKLQRAFTILDMERMLPRCLKSKLPCRASKTVCFRNQPGECRRFFRVEEKNWRQWRSDLSVQDEDLEDYMMKKEPPAETAASVWNVNQFLERIQSRRRPTQQLSVP